MNKLPIYISESNFKTYVLPHLSHKLNHNRLKVSYHYPFNTILYVLKSGCSRRTLKLDNQLVTGKIYIITMINGQMMVALKSYFQLLIK